MRGEKVTTGYYGAPEATVRRLKKAGFTPATSVSSNAEGRLFIRAARRK